MTTPWTSPLMRHVATYWAPIAKEEDAFGGVPFDPPVSVVCRWQEDAKVYRDVEGSERTSLAIIYSTRQLAIKGFLALGTVADLDPRNVEAFEIRHIDTSPSLRQDRELIKAWV